MCIVMQVLGLPFPIRGQRRHVLSWLGSKRSLSTRPLSRLGLHSTHWEPWSPHLETSTALIHKHTSLS